MTSMARSRSGAIAAVPNAPSTARIDTAAEEADLDEVYNTERHFPYVACPRAREQLAASGVAHGSEFLQDLTA